MGRLKGEICKAYAELPVFLPVARFEAAQHDAGRRVYITRIRRGDEPIGAIKENARSQVLPTSATWSPARWGTCR
ncbi:hypothetical protein ACFZBU_44835 [Embleya sp. NPDC008237]|uniref:hypothetical protein n=1 Tax=Embleya sp. NPDC008237 TaxID=3363978 RepID=UPI0036EF676C